jgi:hypothetical protein
LGFKDKILVLSGKSVRKAITKKRNKKRAAQALAPREHESLFFCILWQNIYATKTQRRKDEY